MGEVTKRKWTDYLPDVFGRRRIFELECDLEEAQGQIEEMQAEMDVVSDEFEKDCWRSLRRLLDRCGFDWRDVGSDGVTADDAEEYIREQIKHLESLAASAPAVRQSLLKFVRHYEPWMDSHGDDVEVSTFARHTFGDLREARTSLGFPTLSQNQEQSK